MPAVLPIALAVFIASIASLAIRHILTPILLAALGTALFVSVLLRVREVRRRS